MFGRRGKLFSYQQTEHSDCGLTCVRIILRYYGMKISSTQLRDMADMSRLGTSIKDLTDIFSSLRIKAIPIRIGMDRIAEMPVPAVLYWRQNHFVVLHKVRKNHYYIIDPASGKIKLDETDFKEAFLQDKEKGFAILTEPEDDFDHKAIDYTSGFRKLLKWFFSSFKDHSNRFIKVTVLTAVALVADLLLPLVMTRTIDDGINGKDIGLIWLMVIFQLMIFLGSFISNNLVNLIMTKFGLHLGLKMMNEYLKKLIALPMSYFERRVTSDLIQKMDDQSNLKDFLISTPNTFLFTFVSFIIFTFLLVWYSPTVFLIYFSFTAVAVVWNRLFLRRHRELNYASFANVAKNRNIIYEMVNGMDEIKANNAQQARVSIWEKTQKKINDTALKSTFNSLWLNGGNNMISRMRDLLITGLCAVLVVKGEMTLGAMVTVGYITGQLSGPISTILSSFTLVQDAVMSYERVEDIMFAGQESNIVTTPLDDSFRSLKLRNVSFKYPGSTSPLVLEDISLDIKQGETVAIVGESGCGKTTLLKILLGLFPPQKGEITVNNRNLNSISEEDWLGRFGTVMQSGKIFSGSILSNIAIADEHPDMERIQEAVHVACLDDYIESLPMQFNTRIGVAGLDLSGGQKQRLLLARAIYKNPEILVLDEATSSLDATTETRIVNNLDSMRKGKTIIISAHRLSTVRRADRIIFMKHGRITECGTHDDLINAGNDYYNLVNNQL